MGPADRFEVLVVCTANVCRSPLAAGLLRRCLDERYPSAAARVGVASVGTRALAGHPMDPKVAALLRAGGGSPDGFRARLLDEDVLAGVDLVLTMTRAHRSSVVTVQPKMLKRTYTLRELARIAGARGAPGPTDDVVAGLHDLLAAAPALRGPTAPTDPTDDDVADPYGRSVEHYDTAAELIRDAIDRICGRTERCN